MTERVMRIWIGLFVLLAIVLLGVLIILFGSAATLFKRTSTYIIRFKDAPGVGPGTPVRRSGVRIGEVTAVVLDDAEDNVKVTVAIESKYPIRNGDDPVLITGLLGSDATIDFVPRKPPEPGQPPLDRTPIPPGSEITGVRQPTVNSVLKEASGVVPEAQDTMKDVRKSMQRIEKSMPLFDETLREVRDVARAMREAVPSVRQTTEEVGELAKEARKAIPGLTKTSDEFRELVKSMREAVPDLRRTGEDLGAAVRTWGRLGERLDVMVQDNRDRIVKALENLNEVLSRMSNVFNDSNQTNIAEILKNTRSASGNFDSISRNVDVITRDGRTSVRLLNDTLQRTDDLLKSLQGSSKEQSGGVPSILKNMDESLKKLNALLTDVREVTRVAGATVGDVHEIVRHVGQADGTVSRLLTDPTLYNRLDEAACMLPKLVPRLERILKDFETFADKLARHPELIGVGGAIKGSDGLKEVPPNHSYPVFYPPGPR